MAHGAVKYKISSDYLRDGPPRWDVSEVLHVTPGDELKTIPSIASWIG